MIYAKIKDGGVQVVPIPSGGSERQRAAIIESAVADGFMPLEEEGSHNEDDLGVIESYEARYRQEEGRVVKYFEKVEVDITKVEAEIERLKVELSATDYRVTKNQELQMVGLDYEYDPEELRAQREPLREAIRELEAYLA